MSAPSLNDLKRLPHWVTWVMAKGDRKIPKNPATGGNADYTKPATWASRKDAEQRWRRMKNGKDEGGIGFVLGSIMPEVRIAPDIVCEGVYVLGIDLDSCLQQGVITEPVVKEVVERFNTYTEISPSSAAQWF